MKMNFKRITALLLVLLLTASLLASCKSGGEEETVTEVDGIPVFDQYKSRKVDLGLSEDEVIYDIIEIDGMLRATIGVLDPNYDPEHPEEYLGLPYPTEYRWYSLDYVEDTSKREKTLSYYEITFTADPSVEFALGGEFYEDEYGKGVQYHFYSDEGPQEGFLLSPELGIDDPSTKACTYGSMAHIMLYEGVPFASFLMKLPPIPTYASSTSKDSLRVIVVPKFIAPSAMAETAMPEGSVIFSMVNLSFRLFQSVDDIVLQRLCDVHKNTAVAGDAHAQVAVGVGIFLRVDEILDADRCDLCMQTASVEIAR